MDNHPLNTSLNNDDFNPTSRITWLTAPAKKSAARWLFTGRQTRWIFLGLAAIGGSAVLMIWPVLPANSPAWPIYWLHDTIVSPVVGRIFLRYSPYPELIIASLVMLALFALYARSFAGDMHRLATNRALRSAGFKNILIKWASARRKDSYLQALVERRFREVFQQWAGTKTPQSFNAVQESAHFAMAMISKTCAAGDRNADMALAGIAARLIVAQWLTGKPWPSTDDRLLKQLADNGKDLSKSVLALAGHAARPKDGEEKLNSFWARGNMWPKNERSQYWETLCWLALVHGLRQEDSYLLHHFLTLLAEYGFLADSSLAEGQETSDSFSIDPALWLCLEPVQLELGTGPGAEAILSIRKELMQEVGP